MPEMDGYELTRQLAILAPFLPVIGLTAHTLPEEQRRCQEAGMVASLAKPVTLDALVATLLRHARTKHPPNPPSSSSSPLAPSTRILNSSALRTRYDNREEFLKRLAAAVLTSHRQTPAELREAATLLSPDLPRLATLAHTLKGTAGNLMVPEIQILAAHVEQAAKSGSPSTAHPSAEHLADLIEKLLLDLDEFLSS
jgi:CheY-like chemotaxis protein